jgi:hypothetical protein
MWYVLGGIALAALFVFPGRNAIGGMMTIGVLAIIANAVVFSFSPHAALRWNLLGKGLVILMLIGFALELLSRLFGRRKHSPTE